MVRRVLPLEFMVDMRREGWKPRRETCVSAWAERKSDISAGAGYIVVLLCKLGEAERWIVRSRGSRP